MRVPRLILPARILPALVLTVAVIGLAAPQTLPRAHAAPVDVLGVPLPPGTRVDTARAAGDAPGERHLFVSGRGFRATVEFYQRFLARRGLLHQAIPVYRYRGTEIARFLSRQPGTAWSAVHVYRGDARTWIFIVPHTP